MRTGPSDLRRGVVLLVVISLLMLFAIVGIAFVIYAEAQASTARIWKESESQRRPDVDPEELLSYFLGQLIYDTGNPHSALRGHSLARTLYGKPGGTSAFSGTGRFPNDLNINYTQFSQPLDPDEFGSPNPPYTYPDLNNAYLAAVRANDGAVLIPSYQRTRFGGDPANRRHVLRPLPADHAGFPAMEDAGGDVKNLTDSPGTLIAAGQFANNDSIWLDLGHPVLTGSDGRKFKPLFAPLIQDLDNRVNVNVHGNMVAPLGDAGGALNGGLDIANGRHSSHQGWGPWEVCLQKALPATETPPNPPAGYEHWVNYEARYLFTGSPDAAIRGRFDQAFWGHAGTKNQLLDNYLPKGRTYSLTNSEGDSGDQNPNSFALPTDKCFPTLANWGWENGDATSGGRNNEAVWNTFSPSRTACVPNNPPRDDRTFAPANMEALLRYSDGGSPALDSDLFRLCPRSLADAKARRLITTHAFDLAVPGVMPGLWGQGMGYRWPQGNPHPSGQPVAFPQAGAAPPNSEFTPDWKAVSAALSRINLNRNLPGYPGPTGATKQITDLNAFNLAQQCRQTMARDLFDVLRQVTAAADPVSAAGEELEALRWLAQLAVNIVDYTDKDDYLTPFEWKPGEHVFGNELPRLVLNEAYIEIGNSSNDAMANTASEPYQVRFWVELHSPIESLTETGLVRLNRPSVSPDHACYKLVVVKQPTKLGDRDNVRGEPDDANNNIVLDLRDYTAEPGFTPLAGVDPSVVKSSDTAAGTNQGNTSYYLLGPADDFPGTDANRPQATLKVKKNDTLSPTSAMAYEVPNTTDANQFPTRHTLLLRRLACPYLSHQPNPTGGNTPYNPYITVDYLKDLPTNDAVKVTSTGQRMNPPATVNDVAQRFAKGRKQPYAAAQQADQKPTTPLQNQPQHTFFKRNLPTPTANNNGYQWLAFMDRPLVSPAELLQVSSYKPHELTQRFIADNGAGGQVLFGHRAPWFDTNARIYRLFEFLQAGMFVQGTGPGSRSVGQININTVWDKETFDGLCDARQINRFSQAEVDAIFQRLTQWRTPAGQPGPNDRPFIGAAPPLSNQYGINRTLLAEDPADANPDPAQRRRLFEPTTIAAQGRNHPYLKFELFNKIANHMTTRSNVFAVWVTVGFFEVVDDSDSTRPPRLGAEIGRVESRHVRHRLFAIVDRTNLTIDPANPGQPGPRPYFLNTTGAASAGGNSITVGGPRGQYEDLQYDIKTGDRLAIDSGSHREVVTVTAISNAAGGLYTLVVQPPFAKRHEIGVPVTNVGAATQFGHPGPQPRFDPRNPIYNGIVRHFSVIE